MRRPTLRKTSSIASFASPGKEGLDRVITIPIPITKKRRQSCCRKACCIILIILLVVFSLISIAVAVAEFTSKPGYLKSSQDTNNAETMLRVQQTRSQMSNLTSRFVTGQANLTKQEIIDHVQRATAFSSAVYAAEYDPKSCPFPVQANLSRVISTPLASAMVARDDEAQQIVVAFKGLSGPMDYIRLLQTQMQSLNLKGFVTDPAVKVHRYSQEAFTSLEQPVLDTIMSELARNSATYSILLTGHNTGGSLAVMTGLELKSMLPNSVVLVVTQGQPRTFNQAGADLIDTTFPVSSQTLIRATHSLDGLPTMTGTIVNNEARHHAGEVWQFADPAIPENIVLCTTQEDPSCSTSNAGSAVQFLPPAFFYNAESLHYFDVELNSKSSKQCSQKGGQFQYSLMTSRFNGRLPMPPSQEALNRT